MTAPATVKCERCRIAVLADKIGMADRCVDTSCPLLPRNSGPWAVTTEQAAARDAAAARYVAGIVNRCIVAGMPALTIAVKLSRRGIRARDWIRIRPLLEVGRG